MNNKLEEKNQYNLVKWLEVMDIDSSIDNKFANFSEMIDNDFISNKPAIKATPRAKSSSKTVATNNLVNLNSPHEIIDKARKIANNCQTLDELKKAVINFTDCPLKATATNTVFSEGVANSKIMLIGEAPGAQEDLEGRPFCGDSGKLLDLMMQSINLSRKENIYITNTIFWRPPGNRTPTNEEISICRPFVEKHIALIKPKLIILVGSTAGVSLINNKFKLGMARNINYKYSNPYLEQAIDTTAIFHPAYLLRQPSKKKDTWHDLLHLQDYINTNLTN